MRPGRGDHRAPRRPSARRSRSPRARTSTRASSSSRTCPRTSTSRSSPCRSSRARSSRARSTSARASRASTREAEIDLLVAIASQVAQTIEHAKLYADAQRRVARARGARADLGGGLGVALPRGVARGDREDDDGGGRARPARRSCSRTARSPGPRAAPARTRVRLPLRWKRRQIGELVCDRDTPFTDEDRALLEAIAHHAAVALEHGRAVHARRARPGDPPPGQEQPADRRVAAAAAGARAERRPAARRSTTRSTGSSRSPPCTRC